MENWYKGVLTSTLSTLVSSSLGAFNLFDGNNVALNNNIFNTNGVNALNNLAGGLAAQGLELAMGGNFTLNILNLSMFDSNYSTGLMEMRFGRDGFSMGLGTGGADVSFVNIKNSISGITESKKILDAKISSLSGNYEGISTLNAINNLGYTSSKDNHELGRNIWSGKATVSYADLGMDNGMAILGQYNSDNPTEILLNSGLLGKGKAALLASVMAHEGTHMAGNRIEAVAHKQAYNAYTELVKMFGLTGNEEIMQSMAKAMNDPSSSIANTGNVDYWKLVVRDGIAGFECDGKKTFDLSLLGEGYEKAVNSLGENDLLAMYNLGSNMSFDDFITSVGTFQTLNNRIQALESFLAVENKKTASAAVFNNLKENLITALQGVEASGLLMRTDAVIAKSGNGPQIFADGGGRITSDYGWRAVNWTNSNYFGTFQYHPDWDLGPRRDNWNLVAPMDGTLNLSFNEKGGLKIETSDGNRSVMYTHSDGASIMNYVGLFASNGVSLNSDGSLGGIAQNMIVGVMGNTGTDTTGAHVHLTYKVGGVAQNPELFFDKSQFTMNDYSRYMSGFSNNPNTSLTLQQASGMFNYLYNIDNSPYKTNYMNTFTTFLNNANRQSYYDPITQYNNNRINR
jgi:murein DD-endopeptidase MepM/ murein hydrolase activator NlpD